MTNDMATMVSKHFSRAEMADPTTGEILFADGFINNLEIFRVEYDIPIIVTSGCRSDEHTDWLLLRGYPASRDSFHLMKNKRWLTGGCCAIDAARPNAINLHHMIKIASAHDWTIRIGRTFVHLDRRSDYTDLLPHIATY